MNGRNGGSKEGLILIVTASGNSGYRMFKKIIHGKKTKKQINRKHE